MIVCCDDDDECFEGSCNEAWPFALCSLAIIVAGPVLTVAGIILLSQGAMPGTGLALLLVGIAVTLSLTFPTYMWYVRRNKIVIGPVPDAVVVQNPGFPETKDFIQSRGPPPLATRAPSPTRRPPTRRDLVLPPPPPGGPHYVYSPRRARQPESPQPVSPAFVEIPIDSPVIEMNSQPVQTFNTGHIRHYPMLDNMQPYAQSAIYPAPYGHPHQAPMPREHHHHILRRYDD